MLIKRIAVLGGTGFVGRSLCNVLVKHGYQLKVLTRCREYHRDNLIILPHLDLVETDIHSLEQLQHHLADCDAVINLVGILNERGNKGAGFEQVHVELVEKLITVCHQHGIYRFLQMSALNADAVHGASYYLRTKGKAENLLHENSYGIKVTSFQPSVIFGPHDQFFNRFAKLLKMTPLFFPLACYATKFAPVYSLDVINMVAHALAAPNTYNNKYQLCGPACYTLEELVRYTATVLGLKRTIIRLNDSLSRLQAKLFDVIPGKPFSTDNYLSCKTDSVCRRDDFAQFNIKPMAIEGIVPDYLLNNSPRAVYDQFRNGW